MINIFDWVRKPGCYGYWSSTIITILSTTKYTYKSNCETHLTL